MKTVVIDNNSDILRLLEIKLKRDGYDVFPASDGESGAELIRETGPDIIILETELPYIHGHELIKLAKGQNPDCMVFILSNRSTKEAILSGFRAGADDYMTKPFAPRLLLERIRICAIRVGL